MEQIGRYKILGELGRGAMGIVYRAQDPAIGRIVAIKTIRLGDLADPAERAKLRERLLREAQSAGMLSHPGIVTIYDVSEQDDLAYITMECVEGPTLERLIAVEPPSGEFVLDLLSQTAAALDYAHKRGIVHRDIKPANMMIHEGTIAKITDFGVARIQSQQMTQLGSMIGTPSYMSPEQIQGLPVDGRSDQFSLAVIAYELLTGERPFSGDSIASLAFNIVHQDAAPVHRLNPTLDWPVDTVLKKALSKDPQERYPACSQFASAIENACRPLREWKPAFAASLQALPTVNVPAPPTPVAPPPPTPPPPPPPRLAIVPLEVEPFERDESNGSVDAPRPLRWARTAAISIVTGALIVVALVGTLRWLDDDLPAAVPGVQDDTRAAAPQPDGRPSQIPVPPPEAPVPDTPVPETPPSSFKVRLVTNPSGASLVLDDDVAPACTSPCSLELPPGRHTLAATLEGHRRALRIFTLPGTGELFLNMDRTTGTLLVRSEPRGASLRVDGQDRSEKTPAMLTLPTGRHNIEIVSGQSREVHEVNIGDATITNLAVNLP